MKTFLFYSFFLLYLPNIFADSIPQSTFIETQAKITELDNQVSGRRTSTMATVNYTAQTGENITSKVRLLYIPFLGSFKHIGDTITIEYDANNPYLVKSKADSFLTTYGLYLLIGLGILFSLYRIKKAKGSINTNNHLK